MGMGDADELLFVSDVDFDVPSPDVCANDDFDGDVGVGGDEVGGFSIEEFGSFSRAIGERGDDDEPEVVVWACTSPSEGGKGFVSKVMKLSGGEDFYGLPWDGVVLAKLVGCVCALAIDTPSAADGLVAGCG